MIFKKLFNKKERGSTTSPSSGRAESPPGYNIVIVGTDPYYKSPLFQVFSGSDKVILESDGRIGVNFKRTEFEMSSGSRVMINVWDLTGKENFGRAVSQYSEGAHALILWFNEFNNDMFNYVRTIVRNNSDVLSSLKILVYVVGVFLDKKTGNGYYYIPIAPLGNVDALADNFGTKSRHYDPQNWEESGMLNSFVEDIVRKYGDENNFVKKADDLPLFPPGPPLSQLQHPSSSEWTVKQEFLKEEVGYKSNSPASLFSLLNIEGELEAKGSETGLFGDYYHNGIFNYLTYNVSVLGSPKIGKSCLCARYLQGGCSKFSERSHLWVRSFSLPYGRYLRLRLLEGELPQSYSDDPGGYTKAHAVLLCYDATNYDSFDALKDVIYDIRDHTMPGAVLMVVGLRYDDEGRIDVGGKEGKALADENDMLFRECSAMDNVGVSSVFAKVLYEFRRVDGFALPIRADEVSYMLHPSVVPPNGKKDKIMPTESKGLLWKILSERWDRKGNYGFPDDCDQVFRIMIVGDPGVGKSSLFLRYAGGAYPEERRDPSQCDEFVVKTLDMPSGLVVKLQIWDPSLLNTHFYPRARYYSGTHGIILCFDTTNPESFGRVSEWISGIEPFMEVGTFVMLVGTKIDLPPAVDLDFVRRYAESLKIPLMLCSSRTGEGVNEAFMKTAIGIGHKKNNGDLGIDENYSPPLLRAAFNKDDGIESLEMKIN